MRWEVYVRQSICNPQIMEFMWMLFNTHIPSRSSTAHPNHIFQAASDVYGSNLPVFILSIVRGTRNFWISKLWRFLVTSAQYHIQACIFNWTVPAIVLKKRKIQAIKRGL